MASHYLRDIDVKFLTRFNLNVSEIIRTIFRLTLIEVYFNNGMKERSPSPFANKKNKSDVS